jgi:hypothetical protein
MAGAGLSGVLARVTPPTESWTPQPVSTLKFLFADHTRSNRETTLAVARLSEAQTLPKSERPQISYHPRGPCNKQVQAEFGSVQMCFWVSDQERNPNQHTKEYEHEGHQAYRKPCLPIGENGNRRECKRDRREYRPKHLIWRNPGWNQVSCQWKIEYLTQRK